MTDLEIRRRTQRGKRKGREVRDPTSSELFSTEFTFTSFKTFSQGMALFSPHQETQVKLQAWEVCLISTCASIAMPPA